MFDSKQGQIPGYTGHVRTFEEPDEFKPRNVPQKQIPGNHQLFQLPSCNISPTNHINLGYAGYIKGVKSENVYG